MYIIPDKILFTHIEVAIATLSPVLVPAAHLAMAIDLLDRKQSVIATKVEISELA